MLERACRFFFAFAGCCGPREDAVAGQRPRPERGCRRAALSHAIAESGATLAKGCRRSAWADSAEPPRRETVVSCQLCLVVGPIPNRPAQSHWRARLEVPRPNSGLTTRGQRRRSRTGVRGWRFPSEPRSHDAWSTYWCPVRQNAKETRPHLPVAFRQPNLAPLSLNGVARFWDGTPERETGARAARREPRSPGITRGHQDPALRGVALLRRLSAARGLCL